jgi:hypothetical protein
MIPPKFCPKTKENGSFENEPACTRWASISRRQEAGERKEQKL